jgi:hypothetical protein
MLLDACRDSDAIELVADAMVTASKIVAIALW